MQRANQVGVVLEFAGDDLRPGDLIRAVTVQPVQVLFDVLDQNRLGADAAANRDPLRIKNCLQIKNLHRYSPGKFDKAVDCLLLAGIHRVKNHQAVHRIRIKPFFLGVQPAQPGRPVAVPPQIFKRSPAFGVGNDIGHLTGGKMPAAQQLMVMNDASSDHRTKNQHQPLPDSLQAAHFCLRHGGTLSVIFYDDPDRAALIQHMAEVKVIVIAQGSPGNAVAVFRIYNARHTDCQAVRSRHTVIDFADGFNQLLPSRLRRGNLSPGKDPGVFRHMSVLDKRTPNVDGKNIHTRPLLTSPPPRRKREL